MRIFCIIVLLLAKGSVAMQAGFAPLYLDTLSKEECITLLEETPLPELWDQFLSVQTELYFTGEEAILWSRPFFQEASHILDVGSGNGSYLHKLAERNPQKRFVGLEKQSTLVAAANQEYGGENLQFVQGDAEEAQELFFDLYDVVLFRATLLHLGSPRIALQQAAQYLKRGGRLVVIDACDSARESSYADPLAEEAARQHSEQNQIRSLGNRAISMEFLQELEGSGEELAQLFSIEFSNLNSSGERVGRGLLFSTEEERRLYFSQKLLYIALLQKGWGITIPLSAVYEEAYAYVTDSASWVAPGVHILVAERSGCLRES